MVRVRCVCVLASLVVAIFVTGPGGVLAPSPSAAEKPQRQLTNKQQCRRMTKQIDHYEHVVLAMAKERGNDLWANATEEQISRLKNRRADVCPEYGKERTALARATDKIRKFNKMVAKGAKTAAQYFTGGLW